MSVLPKDVAQLSPQERRALLAKLLEQKDRARQQKSCPLSFGQERLWFLDQLAPGNPAYNVFTAVHIGGALHVEAFENSLAEDWVDLYWTAGKEIVRRAAPITLTNGNPPVLNVTAQIDLIARALGVRTP